MEKAPDQGRKNGGVQPIIQSYGMTPSFVGAKKTGSRGGRGRGQGQFNRGFGPRHKPPSPKKYPPTGASSSSSSSSVFIRNMSPSKVPPCYPAYLALSSSARPKSNSKVWKKPSSAPAVPISSSSSPTILVESNITTPSELEIRLDPFKFTKSRVETVASSKPGCSIYPISYHGAPVPKTAPKISPILQFKSQVNAVVPVGSRSRFKLVKLGSPNLNAESKESGLTFFNSNKYKLDRRADLRLTSPWKGKQLEIARRTIIGGMNLYQRRFNLNSSLVPYAYAVTKPRLSSSFRSRFSLKNRPASNTSFSVRPYSLRRIRKSSLRTRVDGPITKKSYSFTKRESITGADDSSIPKLELSSLSISQSLSVLLATRYLQRSRQTLYTSMRKKNTFCVFYNRFGICKRKELGKCLFVHDPRQLNICSKILNKEECTKADCMLSHDLKEGKVPPCRFYMKEKCSKTAEECPYLHVPSLLKRKNGPSAALSSKLILKKDIKGSKEGEKVEEKARYFETLPNSQPIISIIPRRYPKDLARNPTTTSSKTGKDKKVDSDKTGLIGAGKSDSKSGSSGSSESSLSTETDAATSCDNGNDKRRQRLLSRVKGFNNQASSSTSKKTKEAPLFLAFK